MSPEIKINDENGDPLVSVRISRDVAKTVALVLATEAGSPRIALTEELAGLNRIHDAFDIAARYSGKRKSKRNP